MPRKARRPKVGPSGDGWFVYVQRCADGSLDTGIANDVARRCQQHNDGTASRYTRSRLPVELVYQEAHPGQSSALKREAAIKAMDRREKQAVAQQKKKPAKGVREVARLENIPNVGPAVAGEPPPHLGSRDHEPAMPPTNTHPAQRFTAPANIQHGVPLKELMGRKLVALIGESLAGVVSGFDVQRFQTRAGRDLDKLELKERALHIAHAMAEQMPADFDDLAPLLISSFGPPLGRTEGNGLAPFFYFPHAHLIAAYGLSSFESGMAANYEITRRFTAEFSVRPFLIAHRPQCLTLLRRWAKDANPHVRRLVSEGTRPRLPWAERLPEFQADPHLSLPLLELLKDDPELYVRRSVANHLGDIAKDHPEVALDVCEAWLDELKRSGDEAGAENRRWIVRHAVRLPAKKGVARAVKIRAGASSGKRRAR